MQGSVNIEKSAQASGGETPIRPDRWTVRKVLFWLFFVFVAGYMIASVFYTRIMGLHLTEGELMVKYWYIYVSYVGLFGVVWFFARLMEKGE